MRSLKQLFDLTGRVALVTGGGRGLGEQMAHGLAEAGASVALASRSVEACAEVAAELEAKWGVRTHAVRMDVTSEADVRAAIDSVEGALGPVDLLINNSGTSWGAPAAEMPLDAWHKVMETNVTGAFLCAREVGARLIERKSPGVVINIVSIAGLKGTPPELLDAIGYSASKGALIAFTRDLAVKWARYGIRVNALAPGFFRTKMSEKVLDRAQEALRRVVPMGRVGGEDELVGAAVFLCSPAAGYLTGQVLAVDGGLAAL
jgi:NAD(P)-dependent dehydrogenase (short-subunit alcohol dehydrogenase family)